MFGGRGILKSPPLDTRRVLSIYLVCGKFGVSWFAAVGGNINGEVDGFSSDCLICISLRSFTTVFSCAWLLKPSLRVHMEGVLSTFKLGTISGLAGFTL